MRLIYHAALGALATVTVITCTTPAGAEFPKDDKQALGTLAAQWAINGGLPDAQRVPSASDLMVADVNLPKGVSFDLPGRKVVVMSLVLIQAHADIKGDAVYLRLGPFTGNAQRANVPVALLWAASVKNPAAAVRGSGARLELEKRDGQWQVVNVTDRWAN